MYTLGIIEESLDENSVLEAIASRLVTSRIEGIPDDPDAAVWHINEYHLSGSDFFGILPELEAHVQPTWYIHAFDEKDLFVVLAGKSFRISREKDETWNDMILYGESVGVERHYLENIPLRV